MKQLIIMRGIPGAGKSTQAKKEAPASNIFSTDDYWGPEYKFDLNKIAQAHEWNQRRVRTAMAKGMSPVVIDNTNITYRSFRPYVEMAIDYTYEIVLKESEHPKWIEFTECMKAKHAHSKELKDLADFFFKNNIHKVPRETIVSMMDRWEQHGSVMLKVADEIERTKQF